MRWFTDLRKIALAACVSAVVGGLIPIWNAIHAMLSIEATNLPWRLARIPVVVLLTAFTAIIPVFYFALYRNEGPLRIPKRLRLLALLGAFVYGVLLVAALPAWIKSLGAYWGWMKTLDWGIGAASILTFVRDPETIGQLSFALNAISDVVYVLLLIAIFRQQDGALENDAPLSRLLSLVTKVTVIVWGLWLLILLVVLALAPYGFVQTRNYALQIGRTPPALVDILVNQIRRLLQQACLFAVPYIVYRSQFNRVENLVDAQSGAEPMES